MEFLFGGSSFNIILIFAVLAFALIAIFTDSTPVKWISSLLAIAGLGLLYKRLFPSDSEIKRKFEENQAAANQYFEDRKENLQTIGGVVVSKPILPILDNFLFDISDGNLKITATDLETTITI